MFAINIPVASGWSGLFQRIVFQSGEFFDCPVNQGFITSCGQLSSQRAALCWTSPCHVWALIGCLGSRPMARDWWKIRASLLKTYWQTDMQRRKGGLAAGAQHCLCAQTQRGKCERATKQSGLLRSPQLCNNHVSNIIIATNTPFWHFHDESKISVSLNLFC